MINLTREEAQQVLDALEGVFEGDDKGAEFWAVNGGTFEAVYCMNAMRLLRAKLSEPDDVPKWVYQKAVPEGAEAHHWAVVMHDMDKTVEGWSEDVKMYYDGKLIAPQPEPEPVDDKELMRRVIALLPEVAVKAAEEPIGKKKEWHGLTDEEYEAMAEQYVTNCYFNTLKYAKAIEAKLKEKNV